MANKKTYYVRSRADVGSALDNLTPPWSPIDSVVGESFNDIMAIPGKAKLITKVGTNGTILVSTNGGSTWNIPLGTAASLIGTFHEIWIIDDFNAFACGDLGAVARTVDGGLTWDLCPQYATIDGLPSPEVVSYCLHFISPLVGVVITDRDPSGLSTFSTVFKTIDGGNSWMQLIGDLNGVPSGVKYRGVHMSVDEQVIIALGQGVVWRSADGGASFVNVFDSNFRDTRHLTWINDNTLWATGLGSCIYQSIDAGLTWNIIRAYDSINPTILAAHFFNATQGFLGIGTSMEHTNDAGLTSVVSDPIVSVDWITSVWTEGSQAFKLVPCDPTLNPEIPFAYEGLGIDLQSVVGLVVFVNNTGICYTVQIQDLPAISPGYDVVQVDLVGDGSTCGSFTIDSCPIELPLVIVGESLIFDIQITNLGTGRDFSDFVLSLGTCNPDFSIGSDTVSLMGGQTGSIQVQYTPTAAINSSCTFYVTGPCGSQECSICFSALAMPECPNFNISITGPSCAPDCIEPGSIVQFDLGGNISPVAYPTIVNFSVYNAATNDIVFESNYPVNDDLELDAIIINFIAPAPGKYCSKVCLPGCNSIRILCFDVCEPFDIYKTECNKWHVHRPHQCPVEEFLVTISELEGEAIVTDQLWDISQDNTFEFELPHDGIFIFEMKDPITGEVLFSFSAFETCDIQECYMIMMDKIMCSCADPCCKKCTGTAQEARDFARGGLNKLVPLYMTYLGMARRNELYTTGMKLISDEHMCFLQDANSVLAKIIEIITDCGCLCPEQKNTASNRGGCSTC